jgi:hypothetical protein
MTQPNQPKFKPGKGEVCLLLGSEVRVLHEHADDWWTVFYLEGQNAGCKTNVKVTAPDLWAPLVTPAQPEAFRVGDLVECRGEEYVLRDPEGVDDGGLIGWAGDRWMRHGEKNWKLVYRASETALEAFSKPENVAWMAEREKERPGCLFRIDATAPSCIHAYAQGKLAWIGCSGWSERGEFYGWKESVALGRAHPESVRRWRASQKGEPKPLTGERHAQILKNAWAVQAVAEAQEQNDQKRREHNERMAAQFKDIVTELPRLCKCGQQIWMHLEKGQTMGFAFTECGDCRRDAKRATLLKDFDRSLSLERKIDAAREYGDVGPWDARDVDYE